MLIVPQDLYQRVEALRERLSASSVGKTMHINTNYVLLAALLLGVDELEQKTTH